MSCSILLTYRSTCSGCIRHIVRVFKIQVCLLSDNRAAHDVARRRLNSVGPIQLISLLKGLSVMQSNGCLNTCLPKCGSQLHVQVEIPSFTEIPKRATKVRFFTASYMVN